jgi:hypothetical protein
MGSLAALLDEWGPWILIFCGVLYFCFPGVMCLETYLANRRIAKMESRLRPDQRDFVRAQFRPDQAPPIPVFRTGWPGWKFMTWAAAHVISGIVWLAIR